jgi:hypothetical protein
MLWAATRWLNDPPERRTAAGDIAQQVAPVEPPAVSIPVPASDQAAPVATAVDEGSETIAEVPAASGESAAESSVNAATVAATDTPIPPSPTPSPAPLPTNTLAATATPLPRPSEPLVTNASPFSNLILAADITPNSQPVSVTNIFQPRAEPIYLFFDYNAIQEGTAWRQVWRWDDVILQENNDVWPAEYGSAGTAWIYFAPALGFNPGPYSVNLEVEGQTVASVEFVIQGDN